MLATSRLPLLLALTVTTTVRALSTNAFAQRRLLNGVLAHAAEKQESILEALQREQAKLAHAPTDEMTVISEEDIKARNRHLRRASAIPARLADVQATSARILQLESELLVVDSDEEVAVVATTIAEDPVLASILKTFDPSQERVKDFGRPRGFDGYVVESPRGTPVLIGHQDSESDEIMRKCGRGQDLWFQVRDGKGARVLLRTSMMPGLKGSRCFSMSFQLAIHIHLTCGNLPQRLQSIRRGPRRVVLGLAPCARSSGGDVHGLTARCETWLANRENARSKEAGDSQCPSTGRC